MASKTVSTDVVAADATEVPAKGLCNWGCSPANPKVGSRSHCADIGCARRQSDAADAKWLARGNPELPKGSLQVQEAARILARGGKLPAADYSSAVRFAAKRDASLYSPKVRAAAAAATPGKSTTDVPTAPKRARRTTAGMDTPKSVGAPYGPETDSQVAEEKEANGAMSNIQRANKRAAVSNMDMLAYWYGPDRTAVPADAATDSPVVDTPPATDTEAAA
jgi:hypothetical protein